MARTLLSSENIWENPVYSDADSAQRAIEDVRFRRLGRCASAGNEFAAYVRVLFGAMARGPQRVGLGCLMCRYDRSPSAGRPE